jgi:hypothetical protein
LKDKLHRYFGYRVDVRAFGITYSGVLVGADEDTLYLKCQTTWITLPLEQVSSLKARDMPEAERVFKKVDGERPELSEDERAKKREHAFRLQVVARDDEDDGN